MKRAVIDEALGIEVVAQRSLVYTDVAPPDLDRPPHVRAASAIAVHGDELFVIQDDAAFIARVRGDDVTSIALPSIRGRRRFEVELGNKLDKLDLESCVIVSTGADDELWAFGSGSLPAREFIVRMTFDGATRVDHAAALYARLRDVIGGAINIEGVALVGDELWFFHRGNTSAYDAPAIVRVDMTLTRVLGIDRVDLGRAVEGNANGIALGFTDACALDDDRIVFVAAAEASANAIDDGAVLASAIGVLDRDSVRIAPVALAGKPEGLAVRAPDRVWITVDQDDVALPTTLYEARLVGINRSK